MLKLLQTIIDNVFLSVGYQHTFKLNSDEVLLHDLIKDITAPKEVPSALQFDFLFVKEDCRLTDRQQEPALVPPAYINALQTLSAL